MNEEELNALLAAAIWMDCPICKDVMPFELIEIPIIGTGAACMNCGSPHPETEAALEELDRINAEYEAMGNTPEEILAWQQDQIDRINGTGAYADFYAANDVNPQANPYSQQMTAESDALTERIGDMSDEEFEAWFENQEAMLYDPDYGM